MLVFPSWTWCLTERRFLPADTKLLIWLYCAFLYHTMLSVDYTITSARCSCASVCTTILNQFRQKWRKRLRSGRERLNSWMLIFSPQLYLPEQKRPQISHLFESQSNQTISFWMVQDTHKVPIPYSFVWSICIIAAVNCTCSSFIELCNLQAAQMCLRWPWFCIRQSPEHHRRRDQRCQ